MSTTEAPAAPAEAPKGPVIEILPPGQNLAPQKKQNPRCVHEPKSDANQKRDQGQAAQHRQQKTWRRRAIALNAQTVRGAFTSHHSSFDDSRRRLHCGLCPQVLRAGVQHAGFTVTVWLGCLTVSTAGVMPCKYPMAQLHQRAATHAANNNPRRAPRGLNQVVGLMLSPPHKQSPALPPARSCTPEFRTNGPLALAAHESIALALEAI